jgi:hypothetical protein
MRKASELRPQQTPITLGQKRAWEKLAREFGSDLATLSGLCIRDCAEAGVNAMQQEADKLMKVPAVRLAYEHFQMICQLTAQQKDVV